MLDYFFIADALPATVETGSYSFLLVLVSYAVACFGSYTGLTLATYMASAPTRQEKNLLHWSGAFAMGAGIWSMHFIGMLAYKMRMEVSYDPALTILSMIIAIALAYGVLQITRAPRLTPGKLIGGALLFGVAICAMHYTGMAAMVMDATLRYIPSLFALSVVIAITASGVALWIMFHLGNHRRSWVMWRILAALIMGAAICGMHYTGIAASVFIPYADCRYDPNQRFEMLALAIAAVTSVILGMALAVGMYSIERNRHPDEVAAAFPGKLVGLSLCLTLAAILWLGGNGLYIRYLLTHAIRDDMQLSEHADEIIYLDSALTRSVRMAVHTGHHAPWAADYRKHLTALNAAIQQVLQNTQDPTLQRSITNIAATNHQLIVIERSAFDLIRQGSLAKADALLESREYESYKQAYAENARLFSQQVRHATQQRLISVAENIYYTLYLLLASIAVLGVTWYFALRSIRRWRETVKESQREALQARKQADAANTAKSDFLANMSHELRTPLNSITGMMRLMLESKPPLNEAHRELATTARVSSGNLLDIVNNILDVSKIEAGGMELEHIGFDIAYILNNTVHTLEHIAREKRVTMMRHYTQTVFPYLVGDPTRMAQILTNLIGNAVKYTDEGHIDVSADFTMLDAAHVEFRCEIKDTGIGVPQEKQALVFEKFAQADTSTTRKYGGTGLGLAITKRLVELMGGTIGMESVEGQGSTFWLTIPFEIVEQLQTQKTVRRQNRMCGIIAPAHIRILVAEDHPLNQLLIRRVLEQFGIGTIVIVDNGLDVLQRFRDESWDVILMDCHMPGKNGYETTQAIRILERALGKRTPIVALTANAMIGDREKCLRHDMDDYISKPMDTDELKEILSQWIRFPDPDPTA